MVPMRIRKRKAVIISVCSILCLVLYSVVEYALPSKQTRNHDESVWKWTSKRETYRQTIMKKTKNVPGNIKHDDDDEEDKCSRIGAPSSADVEMYDVYQMLEFDNPPGGVWTQGWNILPNWTRWNARNVLKIFVVPHSHNDPGWKKTFEQYYNTQTRHIFNNMVEKLSEDPKKKFIWAEISYLSLWWAEVPDDLRQKFKRLVKNGQIEIVTGGWVMTDEANSHYYSIIQQLTHGHQWLKENLNLTPKHSWCIDPFGVSPVMPFILKNSGLETLVVQRTHYSVKKYLAKKKHLEFRWKQIWDNKGRNDFLTHMMPFYSYDIPHTCGPDPKICCQFDFKRVPQFGMHCPWNAPPEFITQRNVAFRAQLLLDQYRKKAELYSTNVLLVPLGDDFRYTDGAEWNIMFDNYQRLFDHINNNKHHLHAEIKFGTLEDYFQALQDEKPAELFPTLSGDFFTYSDRDDHYWSGYYTSRPFYKRMDRELIYFLRSAEMLYTLATRTWLSKDTSWSAVSNKLMNLIHSARGSLSLFQHHDGITGTAKDHVVLDYAEKMINGLKSLEHVIQLSLRYLTVGEVADDKIYYEFLDSRRSLNSKFENSVIHVDKNLRASLIAFNSLTWSRSTVLLLHVDNFKNLMIFEDTKSQPMKYQIAPICTLPSSQDCFTVYFSVNLNPFEAKVYRLIYVDPSIPSNYQLATVNVFNAPTHEEHDSDLVKKYVYKKNIVTDFSLQNSKISVAFNKNGLLKAITLRDDGLTIPVHLSFVKYLCRSGFEMCGAYLFLPNGDATPVECHAPIVKIMEGHLVSEVVTRCNDSIVHTVRIYNTTGANDYGIEIENMVDIRKEHNFELAMRLSTNVKNNGIFYTDLNGYQLTKRRYHKKIPLQGNYYPMPSSAYIEDDNVRITLLSGQPLGVASLHEGEIEVMQDRILDQDDNLGLGQGIRDNVPTKHLFRLMVEERIPRCQKASESHHAGYLSLSAHLSLNDLLYPVLPFLSVSERTEEVPEKSWSLESLEYVNSVDIHVVSLTTMPDLKSFGVILHHVELDTCFKMPGSDTEDFKFSNGFVNVTSFLIPKSQDKVYSSFLTFTSAREELNSSIYSICPMELKAFYVITDKNLA